MKISIGYTIQDGAFGGGNNFAKALAAKLQAQSHQVFHNLSDPNLDMIMMTEPDRTLKSSAYDHYDIMNYLRHVNPNAIVIHRINNTSQARNDQQLTFNKFRVQANQVADFTVFVSEWVHQQYVESDYHKDSYQIIYNGGDDTLWTPRPIPETPPTPLKIITHHWSTSPYKGHVIYQQLDRLLGDPQWRDKIEFTFIGRLPDHIQFKNSRTLPPMSGQALADELRNHHIYLTASQHEAGPNHSIEGALCGLPLLYIESGAMPEYSKGYGIGFRADNFVEKLNDMVRDYAQWANTVQQYPFTQERMAHDYAQLFQSLYEQAETLRKKRIWTTQLNLNDGFSTWFQQQTPRMISFLDSLQRNCDGAYTPAASGLNAEGEQIELPFSALALKSRFMLGNWDQLLTEAKHAWIRYLQDFQVKGNPLWLTWGKNAFIDPELMRQVSYKRRRWQRIRDRVFFPNRFTRFQQILSGETKQAIATLHEVGAQAPYPYKGFPQTEKSLKHYVNSLDWSRPWAAGAHLATIAVYYMLEAPRFMPAETVKTLQSICQDFTNTLHDSASGAYFQGSQPSYDELVNGAMKVLTAMDWFEQPIQTPKTLMDTVLSQMPSPEGCHLVDAVYVLYRCWNQSPEMQHYRHDDLMTYLNQLTEMLIKHYNPLDGGFSYYVGQSQSNVHGVKITHQHPVSDVHGTTLLIWASMMIIHMLEGELPAPYQMIKP